MMGMPFIELVFSEKFIWRFYRNEDGTYGTTHTLKDITQMQRLVDEAFGQERDAEGCLIKPENKKNSGSA